MNFYILAGGQSSRMGQNKALLKISGRTLIEIIRSNISAADENICIVTNARRSYDFLSCRTIPDIYPNLGPISGIHAGLRDSEYEYNFFLACDLPFVTSHLIDDVRNRHTGQAVFGVRTERGREPLCTIYATSCLPVIEAQLRSGEHSLQKLFAKVESEFIEVDEIAALTNINSQEDWQRILEMYENSIHKRQEGR